MTSMFTLMITDHGKSIATVRYDLASLCPAEISAKLEITDFLDAYKSSKGSMEYLRTAKTLTDIIRRADKEYLLSRDTYRRLDILEKVYHAVLYEQKRRFKEEQRMLKQCETVLSASHKVASFLGRCDFESMDTGNFYTIKHYLMDFLPDKNELMNYPARYIARLRPVFDLLHMLMELAPEKENDKYIKDMFELFYSGR